VAAFGVQDHDVSVHADDPRLACEGGSVTSSDAVRQLRDAAVLWVVDGEFVRVVDAAVDCLVRGSSTPSLDILAGSSSSEPYAERLDLVRSVLGELDLPAVPDDPDELAREAVRIQLRARSAGILSGTDLRSWVTGSLTCDTRARVEDALADDN